MVLGIGEMQVLRKLILRIASLLLVAFALVSCGSSTNSNLSPQQAESATGGIWSAEIVGGEGTISGFSFITQFTLTDTGSLNVNYFQFLNPESGPSACFPANGGTEAGTITLSNVNGSTFQVNGTFKFTVQANGNTLTLNGVLTGTATTTDTLTDGSVTGTWSVTGASNCTDTKGGTFTMTQSTTTSSSG
jgi:hypothetical protein